MAENVRVVVRCRPMNKRENALKCRNIIKIDGCALSVANPFDLNAPPKYFTYDNVYDEQSTTESLYNDVCYTLVDNVLEGYNGTIFAYGQTGCGKTHTMQGPETNDSSERGIISRSFEHIFEAIAVASGVRYLPFVSYLEIYNENIRDLLNSTEGVNANHALKELPGVGVTVPTLSTHTVLNAKECYNLLNIGNRNRMVGATLMNATSSRSHSIFSINIEQIIENGEQDDEIAVEGGIRRGKLNLVDLAGSERQTKTGAMGERLKEATKINLSLSALGNVISALVDGKTKHVPYRDSKLTRLLQDSLGGNTKTLMISCISPADNNYDETISTLRYASRAKNIANKPQINEDPKDAKLREYQQEILKLKSMLDQNFSSRPEKTLVLKNNDDNGIDNQEWLELERAKLKQEMELEIQTLKEEHRKQQLAKDAQMADFAELRKNYEEQLKQLNNTYEGETINQSAIASPLHSPTEAVQLEARKRIEMIKHALIGGEKAHDVQLKERRQKKKLDAQRRLSALAQVLSRVDQSEDRDLLQEHFTDIQHELNTKNDYLKKYRQKVKALEREVSDLQAEFQLDRADYLETIRRLERNLKFHQQLLSMALPILRKDGKYWDPDDILQNSMWNDDLKTWKLPQNAMNSFKLPPAATHTASRSNAVSTTKINATARTPQLHLEITDLENNYSDSENGNPDEKLKESPKSIAAREENTKADILNNYFRSDRQKSRDLMQQRKEYARQKQSLRTFPEHADNTSHDSMMQMEKDDEESANIRQNYFQSPEDEHKIGTAGRNRALSSWLAPRLLAADDALLMNKTWAGVKNEAVNSLRHYAENFRQQPLLSVTTPSTVSNSFEK